MPSNEHVQKFEKIANSQLKGKTIARVEYLSQEEADEMMWFERPLVIVFTDGSWIFPMADDEGNGGGAMATSFDKIPTIPVMRT